MNSTVSPVDPGCLGAVLPHLTSQIVLTVLYAIIFPVSLLGNSLVLHVVYRRRSMRSVMNLLIVNMAVADLLVTIFIMPYSTSYIYISHRWFGGLFGEVLCKAVHFSLTTSIAASVFTMTVMTVDRFVAIVYVWRRSLTLGKSKIALAVIWVLSLACMAINLYVYRVGSTPGSYWCYPDWKPAFDNKTSPKIFAIIVFVALYLVPLLLMAVLYTVICHALWKKSFEENCTSGGGHHIDSSKKRVIKMLITIVISFGVCWLPLHVSHYYINYELATYTCWPRWLQLGSFWLGHSNSALNPCIYVYFNKTFRRAFMDALHIKAFNSGQTSPRSTFVHRNGHSTYGTSKVGPQRQTCVRSLSEPGGPKWFRWLRARDSYRRLRALGYRDTRSNVRTCLREDRDSKAIVVEKLSVL